MTEPKIETAIGSDDPFATEVEFLAEVSVTPDALNEPVIAEYIRTRLIEQLRKAAGEQGRVLSEDKMVRIMMVGRTVTKKDTEQ